MKCVILTGICDKNRDKSMEMINLEGENVTHGQTRATNQENVVSTEKLLLGEATSCPWFPASPRRYRGIYVTLARAAGKH